MSALKSILSSRYFLWALLALPSIPMVIGMIGGNADPHRLLHPTGEFSARFMIIAMAATPLRLIFQRQNWTAWLVRNRRYFGVAAFVYAALHTLFYVIDINSLQVMLDQFFELGIWTGWLAFFIFIPLAITSNDASMRALREKWKPLQRFVYVAAVMTLLHWMFVENHFSGAMAHFIPLSLLEAYRVWYQKFRKPIKTTVA